MNGAMLFSGHTKVNYPSVNLVWPVLNIDWQVRWYVHLTYFCSQFSLQQKLLKICQSPDKNNFNVLVSVFIVSRHSV